MAVPQLRADYGSTIEAPAARKSGVGFVLGRPAAHLRDSKGMRLSRDLSQLS
jgi:hypothetical protein